MQSMLLAGRFAMTSKQSPWYNRDLPSADCHKAGEDIPGSVLDDFGACVALSIFNSGVSTDKLQSMIVILSVASESCEMRRCASSKYLSG